MRHALASLIAASAWALASASYAQTYTLVGQFGETGSGPGQFNSPSFVAIDPTSHSVVVSDTGNSRVQIFDAKGNYLSEFGAAGTGDGQFGPVTYTGDQLLSTEQLPSPAGIAIDPTTGNIVVADGSNGRIEIFDSSGNYLSQFQTAGHLNDDPTFTPGQNDATWFPADVAIDDVTGNIVVTASSFYWDNEYFPSCVRIGIDFGWVTTVGVQAFNSSGEYLTQFQDPNSYCNAQTDYTYPRTLAVDSKLRHIVIGNKSDAVEIFNLDGILLWRIALNATAVAIDARNSNIVVLSDGQIQIFTSTGRLLQRFATGSGTGPNAASGLSGIAVDPTDGHIFVVDPSNNRVEIFGQASPG